MEKRFQQLTSYAHKLKNAIISDFGSARGEIPRCCNTLHAGNLEQKVTRHVLKIFLPLVII